MDQNENGSERQELLVFWNDEHKSCHWRIGCGIRPFIQIAPQRSHVLYGSMDRRGAFMMMMNSVKMPTANVTLGQISNTDMV